MGEEDHHIGCRIIVNGRPLTTENGQLIDFVTLVRMAGMTGNPSAAVRRKGSEGFVFAPNASHVLKDGDVINLAHTGNA